MINNVFPFACIIISYKLFHQKNHYNNIEKINKNTIDSNEAINFIPFNNENKYLILSSNALVPACLYALFYNNYNLSILYNIQYYVSQHYWKYPTRINRNIDCSIQTISMIYNFIYGNYFVKTNMHRLLGNTTFLISLYLFSKSCNLYSNKELNWYKYHYSFHICGGLCTMICAHGLTN